MLLNCVHVSKVTCKLWLGLWIFSEIVIHMHDIIVVSKQHDLCAANTTKQSPPNTMIQKRWAFFLTKKCLNYRQKKKKINGSNLETRSVIHDLWLHQQPSLRVAHRFAISVRRKRSSGLFRGLWKSAALHHGTAWHQGEEKFEEYGPQLQPPRAPFVASGCSPRGTRLPRTSTASPTEQSGLPILLRDPLRTATISGLPFFFIHKVEPLWCLCKLFLLLHLNLCTLLKWNKKILRLLPVHFQTEITLKLT